MGMYPDSNTGLGVALWLCPRRLPLSDKLGTLMALLNTVFPGQPPSFEPHITVSTNIAVDLDDPKDDVDRVLRACCLALQHSVPHVRLGRVCSQRHYFKKLYFQVLRDPNLVSFARIVREQFVILPAKTHEALVAANPQNYHSDGRRRRKASGETPIDTLQLQLSLAREAAQWAAAYDPHLSLVYLDLHPIDNALWHTVRQRVSDYLGVDNCDGNYENGNGYGWEGGVLRLVLCEGEVSEWVELGSVELHK